MLLIIVLFIVQADKSTNEQSVDYTDLAADGGVFPVQIEVKEDMKAPIYV